MPVVDVVDIVVARAAAEAARPVEESLLRFFLGGFSCEVSREDSLTRSLFVERKEALVLSWPPGLSVIDVDGIVALRAVAGTARLIKESLLMGFLGGIL